MKKTILLLAMLLPMIIFAQKNYTFKTYQGIVENGYNFWVSIPDTYEAEQDKMPVIVFLHGHSLCGSDLNRVRRYGCLDAISMGRDINALIVAPQNPGGPWNPKRIMNVLNWVEDNYALDTNRIYVIGMSLGGYGTFDFVATYPEKFAAAMALCGGSSRKEFCGLNQVPLWIIHGTADRDVSVSQSQRIVDAMKSCGPTNLLRFDKFPGINHSQLAKMFYLDDTYRWLLSHSKADPEQKVNKDIKITAGDLGNAYQNIDRTANTITIVSGNKNSSFNEKKEETIASTDSTSTPNTPPTQVKPEQTAPAKTTAHKNTYHVVKKGDTLYAIARKYHTTVDKLCKINHIKETSILSLGQKIKVK